MTDSAKRTASWVGGILLTALAVAAFLGLTPQALSQVHQNEKDIVHHSAELDRLGSALAQEMNRASERDANLDRRQSVIETKLDEILRRLDRIERKVQ